MKYIAHRVFADNRPIEPIRHDGSVRLDGVELDIRSDQSGNPCIDHAPVFQLRSARRAQIPKSFQAASYFLAKRFPELNTLMLDVKSTAAAHSIGRHLATEQHPFKIAFNCWHDDDVQVLRSYLPDAVIYFCIVPIFSRRIPLGRFRDLYVCNSYPFVTSRTGFQPRHSKMNQHNVNVKLISPKRLNIHLPKGINGICVHRLFCNSDVAAYAEERGIGVSVYGLSAADKRKIARYRDFADYAIIGLDRSGRGRRTSNSRDSVT